MPSFRPAPIRSSAVTARHRQAARRVVRPEHSTNGRTEDSAESRSARSRTVPHPPTATRRCSKPLPPRRIARRSRQSDKPPPRIEPPLRPSDSTRRSRRRPTGKHCALHRKSFRNCRLARSFSPASGHGCALLGWPAPAELQFDPGPVAIARSPWFEKMRPEQVWRIKDRSVCEYQTRLTGPVATEGMDNSMAEFPICRQSRLPGCALAAQANARQHPCGASRIVALRHMR